MTTALPCKACGYVHDHPYCTECGQQRIDRFTLRRLAHPIIELFEVDHGMLFTVIAYLKNPKQVSVAYLGGNTKTYTNPLKLLVIALTTSFFFSIYLINNMVDQLAAEDGAATKTSAEIVKMMSDNGDYMKYVNILMLPIYGLFLGWLFKKKGYNLAEHMLIFAYAWAVATVLLLPFEASLFLLLKAGYKVNYTLQSVSGMIALVGQLWMLARVYATEGEFYKTLLRLLVAIFGVAIISGLVGFSIGMYFNPEALLGK